MSDAKKQGDIKGIRASTRLMLTIGIIFILAGIVTIALVNRQMKSYALSEAKTKARLILDRNLAIHYYFSHQLKPTVFDAMESAGVEPEFHPVWMSSTYAVREIDKYSKSLSDSNYYYKECAIDSRHPDNEADAYERSFLERINQDAAIDVKGEIRDIDGQIYYAVLRRAEIMEETCLRCHSVPEVAPQGLVQIYGPQRSFNRSIGETVSAISIRVPLEAAYGAADRLSFQLAGFFCVMLLCLYGMVVFLNNRWIFLPLNSIRHKAQDISSDPRHLGEQIKMPQPPEMAGFAAAFNKMSTKLLKERNLLEERVSERTRELSDVNGRLELEISEHKNTIAKLEETLNEIKQLRGILPICSYCKKIRDDAGYWKQLEEYLLDHSDAKFSHGLCPECAKKFFPDMDLEDQ